MSVTTAATLRPGRVLAMLGLLAAALLASARPAPAQYPGSIPGVGDELAMDCIAEMESQRDATVTEIERVRDRALELMAEIEADGGSLSDVAHIFKAGRYQIGNEARQTHLNLNRLIADCMYWMRKTNASRSLQLETAAPRGGDGGGAHGTGHHARGVGAACLHAALRRCGGVRHDRGDRGRSPATGSDRDPGPTR